MKPCGDPIDAAILADYWLGVLPAAEEESVEEHLLQCDACGDRLREIIALADAVRQIAREGSLQMVVSEAFLRQAALDGLQIREYAPPAGGSVQCTITTEDDLLIGRLAADLSATKRVDVELCRQDGSLLARAEDIPFRATQQGSVFMQQSSVYAKAAPTETLVVKMIAVDEKEGDRLLGEYTFHHTRTIPGPAGWQESGA
jgi:hypothetical protein